MSNRRCVLVTALIIAVCAGSQPVLAIDNDGYWSINAANPGDWSTTTNWVGEIVATGDSYKAWFSESIPADTIIKINVDAGREGQVIGSLDFFNQNTTNGSFLIQGSTALTLSSLLSIPATSTISLYPVFDTGGAEVTAAEISAPISVVDGTSLVIAGSPSLGGTLKLSGTSTVVNGNATIENAAIVNLTGNMALNNGIATVQNSAIVNVSGTMAVNTGDAMVTGASTLNVTGSLSTTSSSMANGKLTIAGGSTVNVSSTGSLSIAGSAAVGGGNFLNIGLAPADAVTATFLGGDTTIQYGDPAAAALSNSGWGASTIAVRGTSTVSTAGAVVDEVRIGTSGTDAATLEMYDNSVLNTALLRVSEFGDQALVNLYNNARINATNVEMAHWHDPTIASNIKLTLNDSSKLYATTVTVGNQGNAVMVVNGDAEVHVSGTLYSTRSGYWGDPSQGITGEVDVSGHGKIFAAAINLDGNWTSTRSTSTYNLTDYALVSVTGDLNATVDEPSNAYINMDKNAQLSVGGGLYVAGTTSSQGTATLTVTCSPGETASVTANSMVVGGPNWNEIGTFNLSGDAKATITNNLGIALDRNANGYVNVSDNAQLNVGSITMSPSGGGSGANTRQLNISGAAQVTSTGDLSIGVTTGWTRTATVSVSGNSSLTIGGKVNAPGDGGVTLNGDSTMSVAGNYTIGEPVNNNYFTMDVTGGGLSTATSLTVGGDMTLASTHANLVVNSIGSGPAPNGGLQMTGAGGTLYFNGGQIQPGVETTTFLQGIPHAIIQAGGAKFAVYHNVTAAQNLEHDSALGSTLDGGLTVTGNSTLTLTGTLSYTGNTTVSGGMLDVTDLATPAATVTVADGRTLLAESIAANTLSIGAGGKVIIKPIPGGPLAGGALKAVPEPSTFVLLTIAALGLIGAAWRKRK